MNQSVYGVNEMPTVKVRNLKNEEVAEVELSDADFGAELNESLIHAAVKTYLANARQGTVGTKTRGDVSGSGRKLWKQKGTGRARIASIRSPLWKGGGNTHGPQARDWSQPIPKKMRRGALRQPKTREFVGALAALGVEGKTLVVDSIDNDNLLLAARNVRGAKVVGAGGVNIYDVLYHEKLVLSRSAGEQLQAHLDPKKSGASAATEEAEGEAEANAQNTQAEEEAA